MNDIAFQTPTPGHTLPQDYYASPEIHKRDLRLLGETQWLMVDHESRIPKPGDYFVFEFGAESIIIVRDKQYQIRAHYNVCRHRGSRICLKSDGNARALTCPYHAWTYDLDGSLRSAMHMPEGFDRSQNSLVSCHAGVLEGIIFVNLSRGTPPDFETFAQRARPYLRPHNLTRAKVAARRAIPNAANWKLVVENFFECYHCKPAHPLLCSIHDEKKLLAFGAGAGSGDEFIKEFAPMFSAWEQAERAKGNITTQYSDGLDSDYFQSGGRLPIGRGSLTESVDGQPVAPVMLDSGEYDGAQSYVSFNPLSTILASSDHAVLFRFTPRGPQLTDAEAVFLVRENAVEGKDYEVDRLVKFWEVTLGEDKKITQDNQQGVNSRVYRPGVYSKQEQRIADFISWYLHRLQNQD